MVEGRIRFWFRARGFLSYAHSSGVPHGSWALLVVFEGRVRFKFHAQGFLSTFEDGRVVEGRAFFWFSAQGFLSTFEDGKCCRRKDFLLVFCPRLLEHL